MARVRTTGVSKIYRVVVKTGSSDVCLGEVDVTPGRGSSFSLEIPLGVRFLIRGRVFTDAELAELEAAENEAGAGC
jgi:hypothetical protein